MKITPKNRQKCLKSFIFIPFLGSFSSKIAVKSMFLNLIHLSNSIQNSILPKIQYPPPKGGGTPPLPSVKRTTLSRLRGGVPKIELLTPFLAIFIEHCSKFAKKYSIFIENSSKSSTLAKVYCYSR